MNLVNKFNITESEILKSSNFLNFCDDVFAASLPITEFYKKYNLREVYIIKEDKYSILFIKRNIKIANGSVIFCNADFVEIFFEFLKSIKYKNQFKLLTCQSDKKIKNNVYKKKPDTISHWFTVNTNLNKDDLIPIPFGIANAKFDKNVTYDDLINFKTINNKKFDSLYINFNLNTNYFHRIKAKKSLSKSKLSRVETNLSFNQYLKSIHEHKFVLCPWGNGFETHRFWEVIYSGGIPVTKSNPSYKKLNLFPCILLEKYDHKEFENKIKNFEGIEFKKEILTTSWWFENIIKNNIDTTGNKTIIEIDQNLFLKYKQMYLKNMKKIHLIKKINTLIRKVVKIFIY